MNNLFLTFKLNGSRYGVEVYKVLNVVKYTHITKVPRAAAYMEGLISLYGQEIPVVNLRKRFSMTDAELTNETCIIVMKVKTNTGVTIFGAIADSVQEVINLTEEEIGPAPGFGNTIGAKFIRGIGKRDDKFIIILDIEQIFSTEEIITLEGMNAVASAVK